LSDPKPFFRFKVGEVLGLATRAKRLLEFTEPAGEVDEPKSAIEAPEARKKKIVEAIGKLDVKTARSSDGTPYLKALSVATGLDITRAERDAAYQEFREREEAEAGRRNREERLPG
jgi:hypothetical protein